MKKIVFGAIILAAIGMLPNVSYALRAGECYRQETDTRQGYCYPQRTNPGYGHQPGYGQTYRPYYRYYHRPRYGYAWPRPYAYYGPAPVYVYPAPRVVYVPSAPAVIVPNQAYAYPDPPPPPRPIAPPAPQVAPPSPSPRPAEKAVLQPIYFDLNKSDIRPDAVKTLKQNLEWFKQNPGKKVSIQGNCDPRATEHYNIALGQRRAEATKKYLVSLGVDQALLETFSYGKDRPICKEKDETCWEKERRVDFKPIQ